MGHAVLEEGARLIELSNGDTLYTLPEAARAFGRSERTIRDWRKRGRVSFVQGHVSHIALAEADRDAREAVGGRPVRAS